VRATAVTETKMSGGKVEHFSGENITWIGTSVTRPQQRMLKSMKRVIRF
jgi:hypothetical protein